MKKIKKISKESINNKIDKDLKKKKQSRDELMKELKYIDEKYEQRDKELQEKKHSIEHLKQ